MKKVILLICMLLVLCNVAYASNWKHVLTTTDGTKYSIDMETIDNVDDYTFFWVMIDDPSKDFLFMSLHQFNKKEWTYRFYKSRFYNRKDINKPSVSSDEPSPSASSNEPSKWYNIGYKSPAYYLIKYVSEVKKK